MNNTQKRLVERMTCTVHAQVFIFDHNIIRSELRLLFNGISTERKYNEYLLVVITTENYFRNARTVEKSTIKVLERFRGVMNKSNLMRSIVYKHDVTNE